MRDLFLALMILQHVPTVMENQGPPAIVCISETLKAMISEDVVLPCRLEPPTDASEGTVQWTCGGHAVHLSQGGRDHSVRQSNRFKKRVSLSTEELSKGNLSLKLTSLNLRDSGKYMCSFHTDSLHISCYVNLSVEESEVVGSHEPVVAAEGDDVILPCHLEPPFDLSNLTVEWTWKKTKVLIYRSRKEDITLKDPRFSGRTSLFHGEMANGNISLKLSNVTRGDAGIYSCYVPKLHSQVKRGNISLRVDPSSRYKTKTEDDTDSLTEGFTPDDNISSLRGPCAFYIILCIVLGLALLIVICLFLAFVLCYHIERQNQEPPADAPQHNEDNPANRENNEEHMEQQGENQNPPGVPLDQLRPEPREE